MYRRNHSNRGTSNTHDVSREMRATAEWVVFGELTGSVSEETHTFLRFVTARKTAYYVLKDSYKLRLEPAKYYEVTGPNIFLTTFEVDDAGTGASSSGLPALSACQDALAFERLRDKIKLP